MKKNLLYMTAASAMMILLGGCASDIIEGDSTESISTTSGANTITFTLSTSSSAASRATEETLDDTYQTTAESTVSSLIAVVFTDVSEDAVNGDSSSGDTSDTFFECYDLTDKGVTDSDSGETTYTLTVSDETLKGYYQFCLVANADDDLVDKIEGLTKDKSTLSDFQNLVVTQDPSTMIMTSESFYGIVTPTDDTTDIGTINLKRLMARIDILNLAEDITIKTATLKNRAIRALLDNTDKKTHSSELGENDTYTDSYLEDKEYNDVDTDYGEGYSHEIYSYEQYETTSYPIMTLTYMRTNETTNETTYTQDIEFIDSNGNAITLQPNYHYFVVVTLDDTGSNITFTLSSSAEWVVADWNEGETVSATTINISTSDITDKASKDVTAGSILMSDGTVISADEVASSTASPIGIVYTTDPTRIGEYTKQALGGTATGLALALKNASYGTKSNGYYESMWSVYSSSSTYVDVEGIENTALVKDAYLDYDGYYNSMTVWGLTDYMPSSATDDNTYSPSDGVYTNYPAFYYAQQYNNTVPVPTASSKIKTTGWYLPTQGEWYDILSNIGQIGDDIISWKTYSKKSYEITDSDETGNARVTAAYNINMAMYNIAGTDFDPIYYYTSLDDYKYIDTDKTTTVPGWEDADNPEHDLRCWFQTSSELDEDESRIIYFNSYKSSSYALDIDVQDKNKDKEVGYVRCAIAFRILSDE